MEMPDMTRGVCTGEALETFRRAQSGDRTKVTNMAIKQAKEVCLQSCPILHECRDYVLDQELPAGSWAGVWGGLSAEDRKRIHRAEH